MKRGGKEGEEKGVVGKFFGNSPFRRLGYIGLGVCPTGLETPAGARNRKKSNCEKHEESPHKVRCYQRDYTKFFLSEYHSLVPEKFLSFF